MKCRRPGLTPCFATAPHLQAKLRKRAGSALHCGQCSTSRQHLARAPSQEIMVASLSSPDDFLGQSPCLRRERRGTCRGCDGKRLSNERDEVRSDMLASLDLTRRRAWRAVSMITTRLCRVRYHWTPDPGPLDHVKSLFGLPVNDRPPSQASWLSAAKFVGTEANQTHASRKEKSGSPHSITKSSRAGTWLQHPSRKDKGLNVKTLVCRGGT